MEGRLPVIVLAALLAAPLVATSARAVNEAGADEIVVVVIDTGAHAAHQEFDYRGPASTDDQFVAWFDFTTDRKPAARTDPFKIGSPAWDPDVADPFDPVGHGTGTASLVGGRNLGDCGGGNIKTSYAPGVKLGIAKIADASGALSGDLATAVRWAVEVVHADVISMSLGFSLPFPNLEPEAFEEIAYAQAAGVMVIVSAGNGVLNAGEVPYPSWSRPYSSSEDVFVVGSGTRSGATTFSRTGNHDPDVSSWSDSICVARTGTTAGYGSTGGTSFSTPLVAGMAAEAMRRAVANGQDAPPDHIADILRHCATDTQAPYAREGWGFLGAANQPCIHQGASTGTVPTYAPFLGVNANQPYDENVRTPARATTSRPAPTGGVMEVRTPLAATTPMGVLGASLPGGAYEIEAHRFLVPAGATLRVDVTYAGNVSDPAAPDIDIALVRAKDFDTGLTLRSQRLEDSGNAGGLDEALEWTARRDTEVVLMVYGWALAQPQAYALTTNLAPGAQAQGIYSGNHVV